jgi:hypothetical protein
MQEFRLLSTSGILGYGFPEASLQAGLERRPDMIGVDGGSVDPGPHYLGSGKPFCSTMAIRRDLRLMLRAATAQHIPMLIGTCGGAGGEPHLKLVVDLVREIAREEGLHFPMAVIHAEQNKAAVARWAREGRTRPLAHQPNLDPATVERAERRRHDGARALCQSARRRRPGGARRSRLRPGAVGRGGDARPAAAGAILVRRQDARMRRHRVRPQGP